jgi:4-carboxymuconolactone decarboxylase
MKLAALTIFAALFAATAHAQSQPLPPAAEQAQEAAPQGARRPSGPLQQKLVPEMTRYTDEVLFGEVWPGSGLSPRDRSLAVISALIAMNRPAQFQGHLRRALNNGVTVVEASGVLTHLAFYAGWPNAVSALEVYDRVYTERKVDLAALQAAGAALPPIRPEGPAPDPAIAAVAPRFADLTDRVAIDSLWRRSDLSVRDRSLVTIAALTVMGDAELLEPYLRRGVEAGLTRDEIAEAVTHLAFYGGWGKATKSLEAVTKTLGSESSR